MTDASAVTTFFNDLVARVAQLEAQLGVAPPPPGATPAASVGAAAASGASPAISALDIYMTTYLEPFTAAYKKLGGGAEKAGSNVREGWLAMRAFLVMASKCKEPPQAKLMTLIGDVSSKLKEAPKLVQRGEWEKHGKACAEGITALNWLVVKPAPVDIVESTIGGSDYWSNGIRKEFRLTNPDQIAFCDTFKALLVNLMAYVKEHHKTGVTWNNRAGIDVSEYKADATDTASASAAPATAAAAPAAAAVKPVVVKSAGGPAGGLFGELNKGGAITAGLKTVTKDMQTWRAEYNGGGIQPAPVKKAPAAAAKPAAAPKATPVAKPPKLEFQAGPAKWLVEYHVNNPEPITIDINDKKETVYIFACQNATILINGKCKSVIVDSCKKFTVYFDTAMASCEVVNCQRMNIHVREAVSAVAIDKTDGIVVHLPTTSLTTEVVASKSSEMNLSWPDENGDIIEKPIPEQYVHRIKAGNITADVSDLYA